MEKDERIPAATPRGRDLTAFPVPVPWGVRSEEGVRDAVLDRIRLFGEATVVLDSDFPTALTHEAFMGELEEKARSWGETLQESEPGLGLTSSGEQSGTLEVRGGTHPFRAVVASGAAPAFSFRPALEGVLRELNRMAEGAMAWDPLAEIAFRLEREGDRVEVVATYLSGHGGESAHYLEDRVAFIQKDEEALGIRFERALMLQEEVDRTLLTGEDGPAFLLRIAHFLMDALPGSGPVLL